MLHNDDVGLTDSSPTPKTITKVGNAARSSTQAKFGGFSAAFDGSGDQLTTPDNGAFDIGTGDFTLDFWLFLNSTAAFQEIIGSSAGTADWISLYRDTGGGGQYILRLQNTLFSGPLALDTTSWHHIAITRSGTSLKFFIDGTASGGPHTSSDNITLGGTLTIGQAPGVGAGDLNGYIDELRIVVGLAVWTANFTPPSAAYTQVGAGGGFTPKGEMLEVF